MWRSRRSRGRAYVAATLLLLSGPADALPLKRTHPGHLVEPPPLSILDGLEDRGSLPRDRTGQIILQRYQAAFREIAERDPDATRACRNRALGERERRRYAFQFTDRVVTGGPRRALVDVENVTRDGVYYLFQRPDTTRCTVYSIPIN